MILIQKASPTSRILWKKSSKTSLRSEFISNLFDAINTNYSIIYELVVEKDKLMEKLMQPDKEELRRMLFLFWWMIRLFEVRLSPKEHMYFQYFYKDFYQEFSFLKYKVEESYNITEKQFFPIFLKVKVNNELRKKDW